MTAVYLSDMTDEDIRFMAINGNKYAIEEARKRGIKVATPASITLDEAAKSLVVEWEQH